MINYLGMKVSVQEIPPGYERPPIPGFTDPQWTFPWPILGDKSGVVDSDPLVTFQNIVDKVNAAVISKLEDFNTDYEVTAYANFTDLCIKDGGIYDNTPAVYQGLVTIYVKNNNNAQNF